MKGNFRPILRFVLYDLTISVINNVAILSLIIEAEFWIDFFR